MYQHDPPGASARWLFEHVFGDSSGCMVAFAGRQLRLDIEDAPANQLTRTRQRSFPYPESVEEAIAYLIGESKHGRDAYFCVHLFREPGNRRAANSVPTIRSLWLDEDGGHYPVDGPEPTAIVRSSQMRRHLYWRLTQPVAVEWAVQMNRRIAAWAGGDSGKAVLASVLRVPGTRNFKRHPQVDPVRLERASVSAWEPYILEQAIPELPEPATPPAAQPYTGPKLALVEFLDGVDVLGEVSDELGAKFAITCPWVHEHSGGDPSGTYAGQLSNGALWFHCHHAHCQGRGWSQFRQEIRKQLPRYTLTVVRGGKSITMEVRGK